VLLVIGGATGTGKTGLSLDVADQLAALGRRAEIVNADAMQLYRGMDIGTAKLPVDERRGIPHHLFDVLDVTEDASVARYQEAARTTIDDIASREAVPILVGGSGLYIAAVCFELEFPGTDPAERERLERELEEWGVGMLFRRLRDRDPAAAEKIGPSNARRIVRALEVMSITGQPFSASLPDQGRLWRDTTIVLAETDRPALVDRLDRRVEDMWHDGIVDETRGLLDAGLERGTTARRAIGYAQAAAQLRGELDEPEAIAQAQLLTRKYARRQVSWFRRYETAVRVHVEDAGTAEAVARSVAG